MSERIKVTSWSDLLKHAKRKGESLGDTMKRMKERWAGPIKAGSDREYVKVDAPAGASKKRSTKKKSTPGRKARSRRTSRKRAPEPLPPQVEEQVEEVEVAPEGHPPAVPEPTAALAKAVGAFMDSCSVCPGCRGKVIAVLRVPRP